MKIRKLRTSSTRFLFKTGTESALERLTMGAVYTLKSRFTFGKHKGETLENVLEEEPSYVVWVHDNVSWLTIPEDVYAHAVMSSSAQTGRYFRGSDFDGDHDEWFGGDPASYY